MKGCKTCRTLYIALVELMASEGGEAGDTKGQKIAWERAENAIQEYKQVLSGGMLYGKPTMSYKAVKKMLEEK